MISALIFDVDGTILDSMSVWANLGQKYLASVNIKAEDDLSQKLCALSLEQGSIYLKEKYHLSDTPQKITSDIILLIEQFYKEDVMPKKGLIPFLRAAKSKNIAMGIATSGNKRIIQSAFGRLSINNYFTEFITCDEIKTDKSQPLIYSELAKRLGAAPCRTVVFEDSLYALKSAKNSGFVTVAVEDTYNVATRKQLIDIADYFIADFCDTKINNLCLK